MRRHVPGLHARDQNHESQLQGLFLVRVDGASYRWHPQKPFFSLRFVVLEPESFATRSFSGRLYASERALWKLNWFLREFGYDAESSAAIRWMRRPFSIFGVSFAPRRSLSTAIPTRISIPPLPQQIGRSFLRHGRRTSQRRAPDDL